MFGQFFSTKKILLSFIFILFAPMAIKADADAYIGERLEILSEKTIFDNLEEMKHLPEDMQQVLISGMFSSNPEIKVRILRIDGRGYRAELNYKDSTDIYYLNWGVDDLQSEDVSKDFLPSGKDIPLIDFTEHAHWLRLNLLNREDIPVDLILELDKNIYSWFDLFYFKKGELISLFGSYEDPVSRRVIGESKIIFPIEAPPGETFIYMRMESRFFDTVPIRIHSAGVYYQKNNRNKFFHGIVSGITLILFAYALYLAFSFRERGYLYLAALILTGYMIHLSESGLGMILLWPEYPMGSVFLFSIAMPLTVVVNLIFCRHYLSIRKLTPIADRIILFMLVVAISFLILQFFVPIYSRYGFTMLAILLDYLTVIPLLYAAVITYHREKTGNKTSFFILLAIGFQLLSYIEFWLSRLNIVPLGLIDFIHIRSIGFAVVMLGGVKFKMQLLEGTIRSLRTKLDEIIEVRSLDQNRKILTDKTQLKVEAVKELIEKNYTDALYRDDLAASVDLSPDHLGRMFKKLTGEKISDYTNRLRIEEACRRLGNQDIKIIDIAFDVGFENLRTFNLCFSRLKEMSPSEYRRISSSNI